MIYQAPPALHSQVFIIASARNAVQREFDKIAYDAYSNGDGTATLIIRNATKQEIDIVAKVRNAKRVEYYKQPNGLYTAKIIIKD